MTQVTYRGTRRSDAQEQQTHAIIRAAVDEFTRAGIRQASMESIAADAGVSRSTVYRRFPSKDELLAQVVRHLQMRFVTDIGQRVAGLDPRATVVEAFSLAVTGVRQNRLITQILADGAESTGILLGQQGGGLTELVDTFSGGIVTTLRAAGACMPDDEIKQAAEIQFRLVVSLLMSESTTVDVHDDASVRAFAEKFLAPMIW